MNHKSAESKCSTCNPNSLTTYTCYGCHEHNPSDVAENVVKKVSPTLRTNMADKIIDLVTLAVHLGAVPDVLLSRIIRELTKAGLTEMDKQLIRLRS